jgi:hypothetical protein
LPPRTDRPSLLFFTVHKAASSFVSQLLFRIAKEHDVWPIDFDGHLFDHPQDDDPGSASFEQFEVLRRAYTGDEPAALRGHEEGLRRLFLSRGCLYAPIRRPTLLTGLPHLRDFRVIVMLRDPRDCLTSLYFSVAYSHRPPRDRSVQAAFFENRDRVQRSPPDEFVLARARQWARRYERYCTSLERFDNVRLLTYEQLVLDFPGWLDRLSQAWGLTIDGRLRSDLMEMADFDVDHEDMFSHKRQVLPGDHRRKLRPDTIVELNRQFGPVLQRLGYEEGAGVQDAA